MKQRRKQRIAKLMHKAVMAETSLMGEIEAITSVEGKKDFSKVTSSMLIIG